MKRFDRRRFLRSAAGFGLGAGLSTTGLYQFGRRKEPEWLEVVRLPVAIPGLPSALEGMRVVLLSDFHLYPTTRLEFIRRVVEESNRLNPDLVVLTGDFVQGRADAMDDLAPALARLNSRLGIFSVLGNHDHWKGKEVVLDGLRREGLSPLENRGATLSHQGASFYLAGVDDCWSGKPDLEAAMRDCPSGVPAVLLSHEPDPADLYSRDPRIVLQLSGHSHGGQVRFPLIGSPFLPPHGRKYDMGLYRVGGMWLYTNRGIGVTVPIRLNCRPELTELTLTA